MILAKLLAIVLIQAQEPGAGAVEPSRADLAAQTPPADVSPAATGSALPPADRDPRTWSLGVGLGLAGALYLPLGYSWGGHGIAAYGSALSGGLYAPIAEASVERRLKRGLFAQTGITGGYATSQVTPQPAGLPAYYGYRIGEQTLGYLTLAAGLRYEVTRSSAPVTLSVHASLAFGYAHEDMRVSSLATSDSVNETRWFLDTFSAALVAGLSIERALLDSLVLRLGLSILRAGVVLGTAQVAGVDAVGAYRGLDVGVDLVPRLELRQYW